MRKSMHSGILVCVVWLGCLAIGCDSVEKVDSQPSIPPKPVAQQPPTPAPPATAAAKPALAEPSESDQAVVAPAKKETPPAKPTAVPEIKVWPAKTVYATAQRLVAPYFEHARVEFRTQPQAFSHNDNVYHVVSAALATKNGNIIWKGDWEAILVSRDGRLHLEHMIINEVAVDLKSPKRPIPAEDREPDQTDAKLGEAGSVATTTAGEKTLEQKKAKEANRPAAAASMLATANKFRESGKVDAARAWYRKVVDRFPETSAAGEARSQLGEPAAANGPTGSTAGDLPSKLHTWTDKSGKHKIEARLVGAADGKVSLKTANGRVLSLPLENLSVGDQEFIRAGASP